MPTTLLLLLTGTITFTSLLILHRLGSLSSQIDRDSEAKKSSNVHLDAIVTDAARQKLEAALPHRAITPKHAEEFRR
jgi:hypothetical protein